MNSCDVLRMVFKKVGGKRMAEALAVSPSLVHQWTRPRGEGQSGARNPLDRLLVMMRFTDDLRPLQWLCDQLDCLPVKKPQRPAASPVDLPEAVGKAQMELGDLEKDLGRLLLRERLPAAELEALRFRSSRFCLKLHELVDAYAAGGHETLEARRLESRREQGKLSGSGLLAWLVKVYPFWDALTPGGLV